MRVFWLITLAVGAAAAIPTTVMAVAAWQAGASPMLIVGAAVLSIGCGGIIAYVVGQRLSAPLQRFGEAATSIARGQLGVQVDVKGEGELGELAKTFNYMSAQMEAYGHETQRLYENVESGYLETIVALANSLDSKDAVTRGHSQRVAELSVEIGKELKLTAHELKKIRYGGILHDVGKIGIVEAILLKPAVLTPEEMQTMREHPAIGDQIIKPVSFLKEIRAAVRNHHERWDGTGYPDQLKGNAIPLVARIVAAADTWDAIVSSRPYQRGMPFDEGIVVLGRLGGTQLDPDVLAALLTVLERRRTPAPAPGVKLAS